MKISARSHDLRTKCIEVPASRPRAKYFPNRLDQSLSISISSYDQMLKFRNFCFNLNRTYLPLKWRARTWKLPKRLYNTKKNTNKQLSVVFLPFADLFIIFDLRPQWNQWRRILFFPFQLFRSPCACKVLSSVLSVLLTSVLLLYPRHLLAFGDQ